MALCNPMNPDSRMMVPDHAHCFYCSKEIDQKREYFIHWMGCGNGPQAPVHYLCVHPACFIELNLRMGRDMHEYLCVAHADVKTGPSRAGLPPLRMGDRGAEHFDSLRKDFG